MKPCMLVHILYVIISLSIKGMLRARHGDVWELNLIFKGHFQLKTLDCMLVMLSFVCCVQMSVRHKHQDTFGPDCWVILLPLLIIQRKTKLGGMSQEGCRRRRILYEVVWTFLKLSNSCFPFWWTISPENVLIEPVDLLSGGQK